MKLERGFVSRVLCSAFRVSSRSATQQGNEETPRKPAFGFGRKASAVEEEEKEEAPYNPAEALRGIFGSKKVVSMLKSVLVSISLISKSQRGGFLLALDCLRWLATTPKPAAVVNILLHEDNSLQRRGSGRTS